MKTDKRTALIPNLKAGTRVSVEEDSIYDYLINGSDGGVEGGETNAIILRKKSGK